MKKSLIKYSVLLSVLALAACDYPAPEYRSVGSAEGLIDISSEISTINLDGRNSIAKLSDMIREDKPSNAHLNCSLKNSNCSQAKKYLNAILSLSR
jgi:hypothetical protein